MVRAKGGRAQPRYWHLRDTAEEKAFSQIGRNKPKHNNLLQNLINTETQIQALIERRNLVFLADALMDCSIVER